MTDWKVSSHHLVVEIVILGNVENLLFPIISQRRQGEMPSDSDDESGSGSGSGSEEDGTEGDQTQPPARVPGLESSSEGESEEEEEV